MEKEMSTHSSILAWKIPWAEEPGGLQSIESQRAGHHLVTKCFPGSSAAKEFAFNAGDLGLIPGLGRYPGQENGYPFQYSGLENSIDCTVHGVAKSQTQPSDFHLVARQESAKGP